MTILPLAPLDRLMRDAGAKRVSDPAKIEMAKALEAVAEKLAMSAKKLAAHAGRKTIKAQDIELALKHMGN